MTQPAVCVIGGGIGGASAALYLARSGAQVALIEATDQLGGLVASFEIGGTPLERFYHHIFPQETAVRELIAELELSDRLSFLPSTVGVLSGERIWPFTTPRDVMAFEPLSVIERLRLGTGGLRMARKRDWRELDELSAVAWLRQMTGPAPTQKVWEPLLRSKFGTGWREVPAAWMWGRFDQRRGARDRSGRERLGYLRGGFAQMFGALHRELVRSGVDVQLGCRVRRLGLGADRVSTVTTDRGELNVDAVLWTGGLPALAKLVPSDQADPRWTATGRLGVTSVILELDRALSDAYWTNVCDDSAPYGAIIEHTNLLPASDYGCHVVYVARYHTDQEPIAQTDPELIADQWVSDLVQRFGSITPSSILARHVFRTPYAAPLVQLGHAKRIPPLAGHLPGLYVATTAQIYPHDRGMNDGIVLVRHAADLMLQWLDRSGRKVAKAPLGRCPVCGDPRRRPRYNGSTGTGASECGVRAESFRPAALDFGRPPGLVAGCRRCGHASVVDGVDASDISQAYADAEDQMTLREREGRRITAQQALRRIQRYRPRDRNPDAEGTLLDIGCWTGEFLLEARELGWHVLGVEPSTWAAWIARNAGLDVSVGELEDAAIADGSVDVVVMADVLEHLADPAAALARVRRFLAPAGLLYLTVPDAGSWLARVLGRRWWSVLPMHLQYFNRPSLSDLLHRCGFEVLETATHAKVFSARYYCQRLTGYAPVVSRAAVRGLELTGVADRPIAPDFRDRIQLVARRSVVDPLADDGLANREEGKVLELMASRDSAPGGGRAGDRTKDARVVSTGAPQMAAADD